MCSKKMSPFFKTLRYSHGELALLLLPKGSGRWAAFTVAAFPSTSINVAIVVILFHEHEARGAMNQCCVRPKMRRLPCGDNKTLLCCHSLCIVSIEIAFAQELFKFGCSFGNTVQFVDLDYLRFTLVNIFHVDHDSTEKSLAKFAEIRGLFFTRELAHRTGEHNYISLIIVEVWKIFKF
jgi:hypothetical protein